VAQYYRNTRATRASINQAIMNAFTKSVNINENIKVLTRLPVFTYWTTNYDTLIEDGIKEANRNPDVKSEPEQLSTTKPNRDAVVYKMHGDATNPAHAVLTKYDYEMYEQKRPLFRTALKGDLISKTFLFIGFSFEDPNLDYILGQIHSLLGEDIHDHYCFFKRIQCEEYSSDEEYGYSERYELINLPKNFDGNMYADRPNDQTIKLHLNREPRFYSWIGFANGNYEISRYNAVDLAFNKAYVPGGLKMVAGGAHGWKTGQTTHFSVTGYLNKKFTHPGLTTKLIQYPFPVFRLAELYLNYAEALIETGNPANYSIARNYIDKVRVRAGIPIIEESLEHATSDWKGKKDDQEVLRQIVRQERQIEFYLENQRFWDLRRWKKAEALNEHFKGWNIAGTSIIEFFKEPQNNPFLTNSFSREHYLMPVPLSEIERMPQLIQNPYYK